MSKLLKTLNQIKSSKILVIGDLILDRYIWGNADRVSPEAPILVLHAQKQQAQLGGAASVARLVDGLDAIVSLAGVVGNDSHGRLLLKLLEESDFDISMVVCDENRATTTKERFIGRSVGRHPHQVLRVDYEDTYALNESLEEKLAALICDQIKDYQAILIADYAKGVCTDNLISRVVSIADLNEIPVIIDPARRTDFEVYRGAQVIKPNRVEAELATNCEIHTTENAIHAGRILLQKYNFCSVVLTLDNQGMVLISADSAQCFPTHPRSVYDITGAGDMVLAILGLGIASDLPIEEIIPLANIAAGIEVESLGVDVVTREQLKMDLNQSFLSSGKVVTLEELHSLMREYQSLDQKTVFMNGGFDLLHVGHAAYLEQAASLGDVLIVAVNSDESIRKLKGASCPLVNEQERATLLSSLGCVDHVIIFNEETPHRLLQLIRPDILVKGGAFTVDKIVGKESVLEYSGEINSVDEIVGVSTINILNSITAKHYRKQKC